MTDGEEAVLAVALTGLSATVLGLGFGLPRLLKQKGPSPWVGAIVFVIAFAVFGQWLVRSYGFGPLQLALAGVAGAKLACTAAWTLHSTGREAVLDYERDPGEGRRRLRVELTVGAMIAIISLMLALAWRAGG